MMRSYGNYGARGRGGRYSGEYGRRGGRGRYGEDILEGMQESYEAYNESMGAYNRGNYGAEEDGMKALEDTMELFVEFSQKMVQEAESPEAQQIIKKSLKKISQMG